MFASSTNGRQVAFIGQAIMQQMRPRSLICPLQLATAVDAKVDFQSRSIVDDLHAKGFSSSYEVAMEFIENAALQQGTNIDCLAPNSVFQVNYYLVDRHPLSIPSEKTRLFYNESFAHKKYLRAMK